jgi:hypothetical protein
MIWIWNIPSKLMCWRLGLQCSSAQRWGLWEVIGSLRLWPHPWINLLMNHSLMGYWEVLEMRPSWRKEDSGGVSLKGIFLFMVSLSLSPRPLSSHHEDSTSALPHGVYHDYLSHYRSTVMGSNDHGLNPGANINLSSFYIVHLRYFVTATECWLSLTHTLNIKNTNLILNMVLWLNLI